MGLAALVQLHGDSDDSIVFKRLALLFDKVYCLTPVLPPVLVDADGEPTVLEKAPFAKRASDGRIDVSSFRYFEHTREKVRLRTEALHPALQETLHCFEEGGVVEVILPDVMEKTLPTHFTHVRDYIAAQDIEDPTFNRLSGTTGADRNIITLLSNLQTVSLTLEERFDSGKGEEDLPRVITFDSLSPPQAIIDSFELTTMLSVGHETGALPVFLEEASARELEYRYEQFKDGRSALETVAPVLARELKTDGRFGEIAYAVATIAITPEDIAKRAPEQILKWRDELSEARKRYVSTDLTEIADLVEGNVWSEDTRSELERYLRGRFEQDQLNYREQCRRTWEGLFGALTVQGMEAAKYTVLGGAAGGVIGNVMPNATTWELAVCGALVGMVKTVPKVAGAVIESILEARRRKRSSLAYMTRVLRGRRSA